MAGVLALAMWMSLAQTPLLAGMAYAETMEDKSGGLVFYNQSMLPSTEQHYQAGGGTIVWKPTVENGTVTSAELVLTNVVITNHESAAAGRAANGIDVCVPLTIVLNGTNKITANAAGMNVARADSNSEPRDLTIKGTGSLTIDSQLDGITVGKNLTIENGANISITFGGGNDNDLQGGIIAGLRGTNCTIRIANNSAVSVRSRIGLTFGRWVCGIRNHSAGTIQVQNSSLTVRNDIGPAVAASDGNLGQSKIDFESSHIWLYGKYHDATDCGTIGFYSALNIKGGKLYATDTASCCVMSRNSNSVVHISGDARVYESTNQVKYYNVQAGEGGGIWYIGSYHSAENIDGVRPGEMTYILGNREWTSDSLGPKWTMIGGICESSLTIPSETAATIPAGKIINVPSGSTLNIEENASVAIKGGFYIDSGATLNCRGTITKGSGGSADIVDDQKLPQSTPEAPEADPDNPPREDSITLLYDTTVANLCYEYEEEGVSGIQRKYGNTITGLKPATKYIFYALCDADWLHKASERSARTAIYTAYATPEPAIDYKKEVLTGLENGVKYSISINGIPNSAIEVTTDANGEIALVQEATDWIGKAISIKRISENSLIPSSDWKSLTLPGRPQLHSLTMRPTSFQGETDGGVTGLLTGKTYQYKTPGTEDWQTLTEQTLLAPGRYDVRILASNSNFASIPAQITIAEGPEKTYQVTLSADSLNFGGAEYGYSEAPAAQNVTVTNTGNQLLHLALPASVPNSYTVQPGQGFSENQAVIAPQATAVFSVQPVTGLGAGPHTAQITVTDVVAVGETHKIEKSIPVSFTVQDQQTVAAPSITSEGYFIDALTVTITCATQGASIHYTTDGTEPTEQSALYTAPLALTEAATVRAIAVKTNWINSTVASQTFTKHEHQYEMTVKAATCTEAGLKTFQCACGASYTETLPATGHSYGAWTQTKPATCTVDGEETQTCANCGDVQKKAIRATGHSYSAWTTTKPATCTADGEETQTCAKCSDVQKKVLPATGHSYDDGVVTKEPTATEEGVKTFTCKTCGGSYTESIPKLPEEHQHTYGAWTVTKQPTCTEAGEQTRVCTSGDDTQTQSIPALGHSYDGGVVTKAPTTTEAGIKTFTCKTCGSTRTETIPKKEQPTYPVIPEEPRPSDPGNTTTPPSPVPPTDPPQKDNWQEMQPAAEENDTMWKYVKEDGTPLTGGHWLKEKAGAPNLYLFDRAGALQTGVRKSSIAPDGSEIRISAAGDVWMNGHRYYLNPDRKLTDPKTCYAMTDYNRILPNNGGVSYYDKNGITYRGWLRGADGRMRYQTYIQPDGHGGGDYCLIVWRMQYIPESPDPDHPNDPAYNIPAGHYFFDDYGVLVRQEGWHDGKDGMEYYTTAEGRVTDSRVKA